MKYRVSVESLILVAICLADMLVTLYCVTAGLAVEQNPIMAACFNRGPGMFVVVKMLSFVPFVVAVELYRKKNPDFARNACRCAIGLYVVTFTILTLGINMA
ncbi:MAG: DUF5658 family protein [Armatimonadota bacterium]|nr:DUF5658 family protein [bacterium]